VTGGRISFHLCIRTMLEPFQAFVASAASFYGIHSYSVILYCIVPGTFYQLKGTVASMEAGKHTAQPL